MENCWWVASVGSSCCLWQCLLLYLLVQAAIAAGAKTCTIFGSKVVVSHLIAAAAGSLAVGPITYGIGYASSF